MKTRAFITVLLAILAFHGARLAADEALRLETLVYVYKNSDFKDVKLPAAAAGGDAIVFHAPAAAAFDGDELSLEDGKATWSNSNPPARFSLVGTPAIVLMAGKPVAMLSAAPLQYLEKQKDGSFEVRDIPADSPDAPHCRLTFTVEPVDGDATQFSVKCGLELVTLASREKVPGVTLDVGKPVLSRIARDLNALVRIGQWSGFATPAASGGDYSLLMLLRIVPVGTPVANTGAMTPDELDRFATYYYLNPQPDRIDDAIRAFGASGFVKGRGSVFAGFFGAVFAANPERVPGWRRTIDTIDKDARRCLQTALRKTLMKSLLADDMHSVGYNDLAWGEFFATGDTKYLRRLAGEVKLLDSVIQSEFWAGATAQWSLARNAPEHPAVMQFLRQYRTDLSPEARKRIDIAIAGNLDAIKRSVEESSKVRKFRFFDERPNAAGDNWGRITSPVGAQAGDPKWLR